MGQLRLSLLGPPEVELDGASLTIPSAKSQGLLFYLAVTGRPHDRSHLAGLLWGDLPEASARRNLRVALNKLRPALDGYLLAEHRTLAFNPDAAYWLDVAVLQEAGTQGTDLRAAVELYRGEFLQGFEVRNAPDFETWVTLERERLRQQLLAAREAMAKAAEARGALETAIEDVRAILALDAWREEAHRRLMHLLAGSGRRSEALAQYDTCRRILAEELGVEPAAATMALYERIKTGEWQGAGGAVGDRPQRVTPSPPHPLTPSPPHNLPAATTPFVGRERDLAQIGGLLADADCRLLTLLGPGGIGKTRLALEAARRAIDSFSDGVYLASLEAVESAGLLLTTIAGALDIAFAGQQEPKAQLLAYLREREMLLLLDNFEHLLAGSSLMVEMLQAAPGLKLLITSREALKLYEEWLFEVQGLSYPAGPVGAPGAQRGLVGAPDCAQFDAVALFEQRARRVHLGFSLAGNETAVADICRLVEGMPLGIELAAGWTRTVPPAEIASQIAANLDVLASSLRNVPLRHRSLRAVFDHSWERLRPAERQRLRQLSLFRGGFDAEAAGELAGASRQALAALVDKSLLRLTTAGRYDFHPLIHHYAAEKLAARPREQAESALRHSRYFATFLRQRERHLHDEQQQSALVEVGQEMDNARAGWGWALAQQRPDLLAHYLETMASYFLRRGQLEEGRSAMAQAVEALAEAAAARTLLGRLLTWQGRFELLLGDAETAEAYLMRAMAMLRQTEEAIPLGRALTLLGLITMRQGDYARSIQWLEEGLPILEAADDAPGQAEALLYISSSRLFLEGRESEAAQALAIYERLGDRTGMADALLLMGNIRNAEGNYDAAEASYRRALKLNEALGIRQAMASCLINLAIIAKRRRQIEESTRLSYRSLALFKEAGVPYSVATVLNNLGDLARLEGEHETARGHYEESLRLRREIGDRLGEGLALNNLALIALAQADARGARAILKEALAVAEAVETRALLLHILVTVAAYLRSAGEQEQSVALLTLAAEHPAGNQQTRDEAARLLAELAQALPAPALAAAQARGRASDLNQVVMGLLEQLDQRKA